MLRNRNNNLYGDRQFAREMGLQPPVPQGEPSPFKLDSKDERLLELSQEVGRVYGQNDLLNEDNMRLEEENGTLRRNNAELEKRNRELESKEYANKEAAELVDDVERALQSKMETYAPSKERHYVVESDGDQWFAHMSDFTNVQESDEVAFAKTPAGALKKLTKLLEEKQ